jgi:branched-chain amino acid transport system ATP-binding protein
MFSMTDVTVCYDNVEAVRNVSLSIEEGQIVTVIGPNGAGKTTLLMAAIGLLASRGRMVFQGNDIGKMSVEDRVERRLCLVPEKRELFSDMSVADNLLLGSYSLRDRSGVQKTLGEVYDRFPRLKERQRQAAGTLSGGERQMLALGRALISKPRLLLLDEPSLGLAPLVTAQLMALLREQTEGKDITVVLVEQNARSALSVSHHAVILNLGQVVVSDAATTVAADDALRHHYLGF